MDYIHVLPHIHFHQWSFLGGARGAMSKTNTSIKNSLAVCAVMSALTLGSMSSQAADPSIWTGPYVGGHVGWGFDEAEWTNAEPNWWGGIGTGADIDADGFLGGGQVGYLHQLHDNFVFGVDASLSLADIDKTITSPTFPGIDTWTVEVDQLVLVQGRIGWAQDSWLIFAQGGYAGANTTVSAEPPPSSDTRWQDGWTIGGGFLYNISPMFSVGAEYNYIDLGTERYNPAAFPPPATDLVDVEQEIHVIKITGNIHFGGVFGGL